MPFGLPPLPYAFDALELPVDSRTMEIHHDKQHAVQVHKSNEALADQPDLQSKSIAELLTNVTMPDDSVRAVERGRLEGRGRAVRQRDVAHFSRETRILAADQTSLGA